MICRTKKWGNSIGIVIPKEEVDRLGIGVEQTVSVAIKVEDNPLRELYGWGTRHGHKKITRREFLRFRKELESKWIR